VLEPLLQLVYHHEGVDAGLLAGDEDVADLVLDVPGADPLQALPLGLPHELPHRLLRPARKEPAVVELELLHEGEPRPLGGLEAGEHGPGGGHLQGVGGDVLAPHPGEVPPVDPHLVGDPEDVGNVYLDGAVPEGLHVLVGLKFSIFWVVCVAQNNFVYVRLGELLGLDLVLLAGREEVVEEGHVQLEDLYELHDAPVGDVELPVKVEGPGVGVRAVDGHLAVVDVPGELGGVLVLLVLGLEGADANAVLLREDQALDRDLVLQDRRQVLPVAAQGLPHHEAADGAEVPLHLEGVGVVGVQTPQFGQKVFPHLHGEEVQGLLVHGAGERALRGFPIPSCAT
jgi:hypothetical protein